MKPFVKIFLYVVLVVALSSLCLILGIAAAARHSFALMATEIVLVVVTTFFASSSKFAKEVRWIYTWKNVVKRPIGEYPQTQEQAVITGEMLYPVLCDLGRAANSARIRRMGIYLKRREPQNAVDHLETARVDVEKRREEFIIYWSVLLHIRALPIDPRTACPWADHDDFLFFLEHRVLMPAASNRERSSSRRRNF